MRTDRALLDEALALETDPADLSDTLGLRSADSDDTLARQRLIGLNVVLNDVSERFPTRAAAYVWFRDEPVPGFGDRTAADLVRQGRMADVLDTIAAIEMGVHA